MQYRSANRYGHMFSSTQREDVDNLVELFENNAEYIEKQRILCYNIIAMETFGGMQYVN